MWPCIPGQPVAQNVSQSDANCSWHVMTNGDARKGKWRGNCRMQWVASTLHTTSEHGVSNITTADTHTSAASSRLNWRPSGRFKWTRPFCVKDEMWFLRVCHHFSTGLNISTSMIHVHFSRLQLKCDGTRRDTRGEVKGKLANAVGSQYPSHYLGTWCIQHY